MLWERLRNGKCDVATGRDQREWGCSNGAERPGPGAKSEVAICKKIHDKRGKR